MGPVSNDVNIVIGILKGCLEIFQASKFLNYLIYEENFLAEHDFTSW